MKGIKYGLVLGFALFCLLYGGLSAGQKNYKVIGRDDDFYFGHITYIEPVESGEVPVVTREGAMKAEEVTINFPLMPGDIIHSRDGRLELQFDNGTIVRLDRKTELRLETILAPSLSSRKKLSNLVLNQGSLYLMFKEYDSSELFQVLTPVAAVKLEHNSVALIQAKEDGATTVLVRNKKAWLMASPKTVKSPPEEVMVGKGWEAVVSTDSKVRVGETAEANEFLAWNEEINADFDAFHEASVLPKPLQTLPAAVFYFAQRYGSRYGEWVWHDLYGYVWRPFYNDYYPWGTWQPYFYGRWMNVSGSLFWVPSEPWGWVPYHLGLWMWDKKKGWVWIPGSFFAPAWAVWDFYFGFYAWRPWTLYDWYFGTVFSPYGYNYALGYYYYNFYAGTSPEMTSRPVLDKIRKDQLKKSSGSEKVPMPKEIKKITDSALRALKQGNPEATESLRRTITSLVMVSKEDFGANLSREKMLRWDEAVEKGRISWPLSTGSAKPAEKLVLPTDVLRPAGRVEAPVNIKRNEPVSDLGPTPGRMRLPEPSAVTDEAASTRVRVRLADWNPDVRIAVRLGVNIVYDSQRNEVCCPQLGLASRDLAFSRVRASSPWNDFGGGNPFISGSASSGPSAAAFSGGAERAGAGAAIRENSGSARTSEKK